jgi:dihydropteroate synthase
LKHSLLCKDKVLDLSLPVVMGIINVNADSFYGGSRFQNIDDIVKQAEKMISEGAKIIDIGYMSSRPGAKISDPKEESSCISEVLKVLKVNFPNTFISIDTLHSQVAEVAIQNGADMINDISGGDYDSNMIGVLAQHRIPYVIMHMKGIPENMQSNAIYDDVVLEVLKSLKQKIHLAMQQGVKDIVVDPGFGFGKTIEQNYKLLKDLNVFNILEVPILVGLSRKSMVWKPLEISAEGALNGTSALHMIALQHGAKILRAHDVKEAIECIKLHKLLQVDI